MMGPCALRVVASRTTSRACIFLQEDASVLIASALRPQDFSDISALPGRETAVLYVTDDPGR